MKRCRHRESRVEIGLDVDETVFPLAVACRLVPGGEGVRESSWEALAESCGELGRLDVLQAATSYETAMRVGLFPGAAATLRRLTRAGARLHVITARGAEHAADTERFLTAQGIEYASYTVARGAEKVAVCRELRASLLCEDDPVIIRAAHAAGISVFALRHPHNGVVLDELDIAHGESWYQLRPRVLAAVQTLRRPLMPAA